MNLTTQLLFLLTGLGWLAAARGSSEPPARWRPGRTLSADGVPIHFETAGDGSPALVFVHGWCCDRSYWNRQRDRFTPGHRVVLVDLAGHGDSGRNRQRWTMAAFGEDVAAVVRELDLDRVVLVGHSMGGPVIVEAASRLSGRVAALVAVDSLQNLDRVMTPEEIDNLLGPAEENPAAAIQKLVRKALFLPDSDPALVDQVANDMSAAPPEVAIPAMRELLGWDGAALVDEIDAPKWAINSDYRPTDTEAAARHGLKVVLMSGVAHFVMMEDPDTFNRLLAGIVREAGKAAGTE